MDTNGFMRENEMVKVEENYGVWVDVPVQRDSAGWYVEIGDKRVPWSAVRYDIDGHGLMIPMRHCATCGRPQVIRERCAREATHIYRACSEACEAKLNAELAREEAI
jgi:hypothetical protein